MTDGHRTSTIPRPAGAREPSGPQRRPRSDDTRLIQRRRSRNILGLGAVVITVALAAALFVLPMRAWLNQRTELAESKADLAQLEAANDRLEQENAQLQTVDGITEAARADLGYQQATEEVVGALPPPEVATVLPTGWPYSVVTQILDVRTVAAYNASLAPAAPAVDPAAGAAESTGDAPATTMPVFAVTSVP